MNYDGGSSSQLDVNKVKVELDSSGDENQALLAKQKVV